MSLILSSLPDGFPEEIKAPHYFLEYLSSDSAIWAVRILIVLIALWLIGIWIKCEKKDKKEKETDK